MESPIYFSRPVRYRENRNEPYKILAEFHVTNRKLFIVSGGLNDLPNLKRGQIYVIYRSLGSIMDRLADPAAQNKDIRAAFIPARKELKRISRLEASKPEEYQQAIEEIDFVGSIAPHITLRAASGITPPTPL